MAYAVIADVQNLIAQFPLGVSSTPTTTQATAIMTDVSNEMDVRLAGAGYTVPVTASAELVAWLGLVNAYGAAAAVLKSMFPDTIGEGETPAYAFWEARYKESLAWLFDGSVNLPGATFGTNFVLPSTYLTRNPDTEEDIGLIAEPIFSIGKIY